MQDVVQIEKINDCFYLDTGSPHYVELLQDSIKDREVVVERARGIRYNDRFQKEGTNVNFVLPKKMGLNVRTYERGVEDETYSCGTGVTASALAMALTEGKSSGYYPIETLGGDL